MKFRKPEESACLSRWWLITNNDSNFNLNFDHCSSNCDGGKIVRQCVGWGYGVTRPLWPLVSTHLIKHLTQRRKVAKMTWQIS